MKTLSTIIKEIFSTRSGDRKPLSEIQPNLSTQNQKEDEAETDEISGNSELGDTDARESVATDQKCQAAESGDGESGGGKSGNLEGQPSDNPDERDIEREIRLAYEKGVIDGRNSLIEEKFFPTTEDGIPHFRGMNSPKSSGDDIFSMAREA